MKQIYKIIALMLIVISLTGCWDQKIYEQLGFILNIGIDKASDGKILLTYSLPIISPTIKGNGSQQSTSSSQEDRVEVGSAEVYLLREAREIGRESYPKRLEGGMIQNVLISKEFALEKPISSYLELFERDTSNSVQASVIIVDGKVNELMTKAADFNAKPRLAFYLNELMASNFDDGYCPKQSIINYDILHFIDGVSPILPMIKLEPNAIKVTGTALIDRDRMSGQMDTQESAFLFILMGKTKKSEITFDLPKDIASEKKKGIVFIKSVKTKSKAICQGDVPIFNFDIKLNVILDEYTWGKMDEPWYKKKIEDSLNSRIKSGLIEVFKKLQAARCDPIGFGERTEAYNYKYWKKVGGLEGWKDAYQKAPVNLNVKCDIVRNGEIH